MEKKTYAPQTVAWIKKTKIGDDYLSVRLKDGSWVNLFRNGKKSNEKQPDWYEIVKEEKTPEGFVFNSSVDDKQEIPF